jgi:hypothetical protein
MKNENVKQKVIPIVSIEFSSEKEPKTRINIHKNEPESPWHPSWPPSTRPAHRWQSFI